MGYLQAMVELVFYAAILLQAPPEVQIIEKFKVHRTVANLPGRGCKRKTDDKLKRRTIGMETKEPRTTSKEIRGELQGQGSSVSDHTIHHCLSQSGLNGGHRC